MRLNHRTSAVLVVLLVAAAAAARADSICSLVNKSKDRWELQIENFTSDWSTWGMVSYLDPGGGTMHQLGEKGIELGPGAEASVVFSKNSFGFFNMTFHLKGPFIVINR